MNTLQHTLALPMLTMALVVSHATHADGPLKDVRGQVAAANEAIISSQISARITELAFKEGERFKRGQILVAFDCALYTAQLNAARAAQGAKNKQRDSSQELANLNAIGALDLDVAIAQARQARAEANAAATLVSRCKIEAPFDGRVVERLARPFESVAEEQQILHIVDASELDIEVIAPSKWLLWLEAGNRFSFTVDETQTRHQATVTRLGAKVDPVSHTVKVYGRFTDTPERVRVGMSGIATFEPPTGASSGS